MKRFGGTGRKKKGCTNRQCVLMSKKVFMGMI